jgi:hypothetical protein
MLQRPSRNSKAEENSKYLSARLVKWKEGNINELVSECRTIQNRLKKTTLNKSETKKKAFCRLMLQGKVSKARKCIDKESCISGIHDINDTVVNQLKLKHPEAEDMDPDFVEACNEEDTVEPVIFEGIDTEMIYLIAKNMSGSGGPTKLDSDLSKTILCSKSSQLSVSGKNVHRQIIRDNFLQEGTTRGDSDAMDYYAIATYPLIKRLNSECKSDNTKWSWYADDALFILDHGSAIKAFKICTKKAEFRDAL